MQVKKQLDMEQRTGSKSENEYIMAESEEEQSEKVGLKFNIQKTKIMASGPITSWERDGETVSDFIFLELFCFFYASTDVVNLTSGSSAF